MSTDTPIPRDTRERVLVSTPGQTSFGPFDFVIYDLLDVAVAIQGPGASDYTALDAADFTVVAVGSLPGYFSVTLDTAPTTGSNVRIRGVRQPERSTDVTRGGTINSVPLETELDKITIEMQELRRDIDDAKGPTGDAGEAATIAIGSVTTGAPGSMASVVNVGTPNAATLNISIPRGNAGTNGNNGLDGTDPGHRFLFSSSIVVADPTAGKFLFDNATLGSATKLVLSAQTAESGSPNIHNFMATWDGSTSPNNKAAITIKKIGAPGVFVEGTITGAKTDHTGWIEFPFTVSGSAGTIAAGDAVSIQWSRTGDQGASGAGTGDVTGPATNSADFIPQWNGANSKALKNGFQVSTLGAALLNAASKTLHGILIGNANGDPATTAAMTDGQILVGQTGADPLPKTISGDIGFTAAGVSAIAAQAVTFAKLGLSATQRLLGRNTAGAGAGEELTLSAVLDWLGATRGMQLVRGAATWASVSIGSANTIWGSNGTDPSWQTLSALIDGAIGSTRGSILYRGASGWAARTPGTSGYVWTSAGAGADPDWQAAGGGGSVNPATNGGRLTFSTGVPYMTSAVLAATSIYWTPRRGKLVSLYDGVSSWASVSSPEVSIGMTQAMSGTTRTADGVITGLTDTSQLVVGMKGSGSGVGAASVINSIDSSSQVTMSVNGSSNGTNTITFKLPASTMYDVFGFNNSGALKLEFTKWTNDTTRATALVLQDGVYVKTGATTRRWLGTFRTAADGQSEWSFGGRSTGGTPANLLLFNADNQKEAFGAVGDSTASWSYTSGTWRASNNSTGMRVNFVIGLSENLVRGNFACIADGNTSYAGAAGIALDGTSTASGNFVGMSPSSVGANVGGTYFGLVAAGFHFLQAVERGGTGGITFYGSPLGATSNSLSQNQLDFVANM